MWYPYSNIMSIVSLGRLLQLILYVKNLLDAYNRRNLTGIGLFHRSSFGVINNIGESMFEHFFHVKLS